MGFTGDGHIVQADVQVGQELGNFEKLQLSSLDFQLIDQKKTGALYGAEQNFGYQGQSYKLSAFHRENYNHCGQGVLEDFFYFYVSDNQGLVLKFDFRLDREKGKCRSDISKTVHGKARGLGTEFYKKMLDFMDFLARRDSVEFVHTVEKVSLMSDQDWLKKFNPILSERHYERVRGEEDEEYMVWKKKYSFK